MFVTDKYKRMRRRNSSDIPRAKHPGRSHDSRQSNRHPNLPGPTPHRFHIRGRNLPAFPQVTLQVSQKKTVKNNPRKPLGQNLIVSRKATITTRTASRCLSTCSCPTPTGALRNPHRGLKTRPNAVWMLCFHRCSSGTKLSIISVSFCVCLGESVWNF